MDSTWLTPQQAEDICASLNNDSDTRHLMREMTVIYDCNLIWGEDLMEIPVTDPRPAKLE